MNPLMEQLHDIEGIDPAGWWPLAIGWWILMLLLVLTAAIAVFFLLRRLAYRRSWKNDALKQLEALEGKLTEATAREAAITLSELIRRIAIARYSRKICAGLTGSAWLDWLAVHDPCKFEWREKGKVLIQTPYTPHERQLPVSNVKEALQAMKRWVQ